MAMVHTTSIHIDHKKKFFVLYLVNRLLIALLSFVGLSLDGYQLSDLFFGCSVILWVWLPELDELELNYFFRTPERKYTRVVCKKQVENIRRAAKFLIGFLFLMLLCTSLICWIKLVFFIDVI